MENTAAEPEEYEAIFRANYNPAFGVDVALIALKDAGASVVRSKFIVCKVLRIGLEEADHLVLTSAAWRDQMESIEMEREQMWERWAKEAENEEEA